MTRILRLLLIAAIVLPYWQPIAAQRAIGGDEPVRADVNEALCKTFKMRNVPTASTYEVIQNRDAVPEGQARVTLAAGNIWSDGSGYQMLLDSRAQAYSYINTLNSQTTQFYNRFDYKIPVNADGSLTTQNVVVNDQVSILIPAGTYDYVITNPTPGDRIYIATDNGGIPGRYDNYVFESGKSYVFTLMLTKNSEGNYGDGVYLEISQPYMALLSGDGAFGDVQIGEAKTATITVMNTGEEPFTPVVNCDNSAFTITTTGSGMLASGASRSYVVTFAPTALQDYNGTFTLTASELAEVDFHYTIPLSGTGVGEGHQGDVAGGTNQSGMFPVYGQYFNYGTSSQMIYPASMLTAQEIQVGDVINSLTFYVQGNGNVPSNIGSTTVTVSLGRTSATEVKTEQTMTNNRNDYCTEVFNGTLTTGQNTLTINLTTPYQYMGDNLIVDFVAARGGSSANCNWVGENNHTNASYNVRNGRNTWSSTTPTQGSFLPKISIGYSTMPELEATTSLDFGTVSIGDGNALTAIVKNEGNADVQAALTISPNPPFSVANNSVTIAANSFAIIPVTFMPNAEGDYSGTLAIVAGSETINIPLTGKAIYTGPEAIRDTTFFNGITYTWPITGSNANTNESSLGDIATDPEQIIAMLREVYMNKSIPGNYKRGFTATGGKDHDYDVIYTGVGTINSSHQYVDTYGWNIPASSKPEDSNDPTKGINNVDNYWFMNEYEYKPDEEGVTLLLVEMVDDFKKPDGITKATTTYEELKNYIEMSIKSVRIIPDARRTGEGIERGTLFKIDCDKMNKFYLLAKGQLLWFDNQKSNIDYSNPVYYNNTYTDEGLAFSYLNGPALLCHMFEQFSPTMGNAVQAKADLYWDLIDMKSFGVIHDCPNVPFVQNGHHFMMYGSDSDSKDCQDVRDMMFFVPDYRMLEHLNRGSGGFSENRSQDYFRYNTKHQPTMGLFVIHQNEIPEGTKDLTITNPSQEVTGLYKHQLSWKSNLDDFLPGEEQYYELWEIVVDDFGMEKYVPVNYRNAQGQYKVKVNGSETWVSDTTGLSDKLVQVKLERVILATGEEGFSYEDVYVDMKEYSQTKTYVIRGRDQGEFLSLQMSNQQEIVIPGTDPNEKARMIAATYYSRYNPANEKNCYSNRIELSNNGMTLTATDLNNEIKFYRSSRAAKVDTIGNVVTDAQGNIEYADSVHKELVATGVASGSTLTLTLSNQSASTDYPNGTVSGTAAGYHANSTLSFPYTITDGVVHFTNGFSFWDNFTVDVSKNTHPLQYLYKMENGEAYSNQVRVPIYKTDSKITSYSLAQVEGDENGEMKLEDPEFSEKIQLSSKTEILRYDVYRWKENDTRSIIATVDGDDELDLAPDGLAGNQGDYYTVTMNATGTDVYYVGDTVSVSTTSPINWATFVDYYPNKQTDAAHDYLYAPVIELRTKGYKEELDANENKVPRDDYNTYGGPQQKAANGKLELNIIPPEEGVMSDYSWEDGGNEYAYYNLYFNLKRIDDSSNEIPVVPEGYQFYKIRAWRQILDMNDNPAPQYLREQAKYANNAYIQGRMGDATTTKYKIEEFTYPECVVDMTDNTAAMNKIEEFGSEDVEIEDGVFVKKGAFGALKAGEGSDVEFKIKYVVRVYFAPADVVTAASALNGSKATPEEELKSFYVVEAEDTYVVDDKVPTAINNILDVKQVVGVKYYNVAGVESNTPFQGVNIVVTRYSDGSMTTKKILK